jgi:hypothetical protein
MMAGMYFMLYHMKSTKNKGSITIESSIALSIFICVTLSLAFFIKIVYTHEIVQHALNQTANEISQLSYLYLVKEAIGIEEKIFENLDEEIKDIYEDDFDRLCLNLAKIYMAKYFTDNEIKDSSKKLKGLNIIDGLDGLDMSMSSFLSGDKKDIDIVVMYEMDMPVPIKVLPALNFIQRATVKAWFFGDEDINKIQDDKEDVWSLDNFTRGRKIREIFGANLPLNFPVIARFSLGTATAIKSMDLTARSYQDPKLVKQKLCLYINELAKYLGQEKPWGKDRILIEENDIKERQLLLVIPKNEVKEEITKSLEECILYGKNNNVILKIEKFGYKKDSDFP